GVNRVEDLPVNIRGLVAEAGEAALTEVLNRHADVRMAREIDQVRGLTAFGWLSPTVAVAAASRTLAGTNLAAHHRFLREAEALRLEFVQRLNRLHANKLAYRDDIQRSNNPEAERRTRVDPQNWSLLRNFTFVRATPSARIASTIEPWLMLALWIFAALAACLIAARRIAS
ncbi:MAG: DUF3526 domain-containing protein, partial [Myxococcota bacterium]